MADQETIKGLRKSLKTYKAHVNKTLKECSSLDTTRLGFQAIQLQKPLDNLEERWDKYERTYYELYTLLRNGGDENAIREEEDKFDTQREIKVETVRQCYEKLARLSSASTTRERRATPTIDPLKLPPITLPKFTGDPIEFEEIWDPNIDNDRVGPIDVLIGADQCNNFIADRTIIRDGMHLMETAVGHSLTGPIPANYPPAVVQGDNTHSSQNAVVVTKVTEVVDPVPRTTLTANSEMAVHKLWDLDVIGIDTTKPAPDETKSYQDYLDTVQYQEGQYWVKLPWKTNKPELPTNYRKALGQMYSLVRELQRKGDHLQLYHQIIQDQQKANFIEEVPLATPAENTHYLPHHAVAKDSVTTPLRIVFNCSAKESPQAASLNDCLMTGPSLTEKIGDVLMKFRTGKFAYTADISKAFLRVGLQEGDRDFT